MGLIWDLEVVAGNVSEAAGAKLVFAQVAGHLPRWEVVWVDGGYQHRNEEWVSEHYPFRVEVIKPNSGRKGWQLLPKRWVVERIEVRGLVRGRGSYEASYPEPAFRSIGLALVASTR